MSDEVKVVYIDTKRMSIAQTRRSCSVHMDVRQCDSQAGYTGILRQRRGGGQSGKADSRDIAGAVPEGRIASYRCSQRIR